MRTMAIAAALAALAAQGPIRTADITVRGLTPSDFPRVTTLAPNVYAYEQVDPTKRTVTVNNLIVVTPDGVLVGDGQGTVANTQRLVADIAKLTPQPITYVVVGSEHGDHRGGDKAFPPTATFIKRDDVAEKRTLQMGGEEIDVLFLGRAHTGRDLEVWLPREQILYMSEVFSNRIFPSLANGYPSEWIETLKKAEALGAAWYVPAHGFVDGAGVLKEEERTYRAALERIVAEGTRLHDRKVPIESAPAAAILEPYDAWTRAGNNAFAALRRVYQQLDGELR